MSAAQGSVKTDPMNSTKGRFTHNYSSFDRSLSYRKNMLVRWADYTPSFEMEGVPKDSIRLNTKDLIDSLSLNSPFKGTIRKIKESFKVPNMAMLPMNWDLIYTQPSNGGDVPADANTVFTNFPTQYSTFIKNCFSRVYSYSLLNTMSDAMQASYLTALMRCMVLGEYVYSKGSLLNFCGYKANAQFRHQYFVGTSGKGGYDFFFDSVMVAIFQNIHFFTYNVSGKIYLFRGLSSVIPSNTNADLFGSFRSFLDLYRENPTGQIFFSSGSYDKNAYVSAVSALQSNGVINPAKFEFILPPASASVPSEGEFTELNPNTLNYSRLVAYQLICAHFYTNSSIDIVYSAELFRTYIKSWELIADNFTLNGVNRPYDYLSGHQISRSTFLTATGTIVNPTYDALNGNELSLQGCFAIMASLFSFRHSLRYGDYFVGSRPRPLAPINTDVAVNNNAVSVIDITQKIQAQRFANAVARTRQKIDNYVDALFGSKPDVDYHNPLYLSREVDVIYGEDVQNTGINQVSYSNSRTANMRGGLGQFTFTFHNDDNHPCVYMQIISFDIKRAYTRSVDRQFLHIDRFDMFNPDFQYIGDQPVYGIELGYPGNVVASPLTLPAVFGYQGRDMEYKQRFDVCCGGFEDNLPGWVLTDVDRSRSFNGVLDPDFIRNYNTELDQFYISITGYSLGTYFHFICITQNNVDAKRAMAVDPQILG